MVEIKMSEREAKLLRREVAKLVLTDSVKADKNRRYFYSIYMKLTDGICEEGVSDE